MPLRLAIQDALRDIRAVAPTSKNTYQAVLNADGSIQVTRNNSTILPNKFWWNAVNTQGAAKTDANSGSNDTIVIQDADGSNSRVGDFQTWLLSLN
jgi:hypothetical protein